MHTDKIMFRFSEQLEEIRDRGLERKMKIVSSASDSYIKIGRKKLLNLCSNNYLGLAFNRRLKEAAVKAINEFGIGAGASRLVSGNTVLHQELEEKLAHFKGTEASLVYPSGYSANLGIISALVSRDDTVFSDRLNHASIIDGIILSRAELARYPHKDLGALESLLKQKPSGKNKLIVTDSVFSMDGDIAPIPGLVDLAEKYDCLLMIDDAHATGVLGKEGGGSLSHFNIKPASRVIQMATLSKAFGCLGGFVCADREVIDYLVNKSRAFIFSTALPVSICASALKALDIIKNDDTLRERLWQNARHMRQALKDMGFDTLESETPIIPILTKDPKLTMEFSRRLFEEGIFVQGIRPPTVPEGLSRLRLTVMATHTKKDLEFALEKFKESGKKAGII